MESTDYYAAKRNVGLFSRYEIGSALFDFAVGGFEEGGYRLYLHAVGDICLFHVVERDDRGSLDGIFGADVVENDFLAVGELPGGTFLGRELDIVEIDVLGCVDDEACLGFHVDVVEREILYRHFLDAADITDLLDFATGDVAQVYVAEDGGAFAYRLYLRSLVVEEVEDECVALNVAHDNVVDTNLFHHASASAGGFQPDAGIGAVKYAVRYGYTFHAARHFAADDHTAVTRQHDTVGDGYVFAGFAIFAAVGITSRFDGDAVVTHTDKAVGDTHVAARGGIDAVGIGPFRILVGILDGHAVYHDIVAEGRVDGPKRRIDDFYVLDENVGTFKKLYEGRAEHATFERPFVIIRDFQVCVGLFPHALQFALLAIGKFPAIVLDYFLDIIFPRPPFKSVAVEGAASGDGQVVGIMGVDERRQGVHDGTFPADFYKREIILEIVGESYGGTRLDVQGDVAFHFDGGRQIVPGREVDGAATLLRGFVDGFIYQFGACFFPGSISPQFFYVIGFGPRERREGDAE